MLFSCSFAWVFKLPLDVNCAPQSAQEYGLSLMIRITKIIFLSFMKAKKFFCNHIFFIFDPTHYALFGELSVDRLWQKTFHNRNKSKVSLLMKEYFKKEKKIHLMSQVYFTRVDSGVKSEPLLHCKTFPTILNRRRTLARKWHFVCFSF